MNITFRAPELLWLFAVVPPLIAVGWAWLWHASRRAREEFMPSPQRIHERPTRALQMAALALIDLALGSLLIAGIMHPERKVVYLEPVWEHAATVVAVDVSASMKAEAGYFGDGGRLGAVKQAFRDLLSAAPLPDAGERLWRFWERGSGSKALMEGQRIGVVAFAGEAFMIMPPTARHGTILSALRHLSADTVAVQGTNFPGAIEESLPLFGEDDKIRTIIIFTDGEEEEGRALPLDPILEKAVEARVKIFTVVVGHERAIIPGTEVWTEAGETVPRRMAEVTGGDFFRFAERGKLYHKLAEIFSGIREASREPVVKQENLQPWVAVLFLAVFFVRVGVQRLMTGAKPNSAKPALP